MVLMAAMQWLPVRQKQQNVYSPLCSVDMVGISGGSGQSLFPQPLAESVNFLHPLINPLLLNLSDSLVCHEEP